MPVSCVPDVAEVVCMPPHGRFRRTPRVFGVPDVEAHLGDVAPSRKFDRCPNCAIEVDLVMFEIIAIPKFVGMVDTEAEGNVNRAVIVCCDRPIGTDWKWGASQPLSTWSMASFRRVSALRKPDALERVA